MIRLGVVLGVSMFAVTAVADDNICATIVQDTLAELRAGSPQGLTSATEEIARSAAGSACVKAVSGRYLTSETVGASSAAAASTVVEESIAPSGSNAASSATAKSEEESEESGGLKFTPMSGSPSKKPYERNR